MLEAIDAAGTTVIIHPVKEVELDEMWSFVGNKTQPRWLWQALDHRTGQVLAYVFGRRQDTVFLALQALLKPFGITRYYTDGWGAYDTICFSKTERMHDLVIGLFINRYEFGRAI